MNEMAQGKPRDSGAALTARQQCEALRLMCDMPTPQRMQSPTPFGVGVLLGEEEHEQKDDQLHQLFVVQLHFDCQLEHGNSPVYAGSAANWLGLAICYTPLHGVALGLPRMALSGSLGFAWESNHRDGGVARNRFDGRGKLALTLSRAVTRQLGVLTQVRYPARGSARVTPILNPNVMYTAKSAV